MTKLDASKAEITVNTFREGALAAIGHDLKIRATDFSVEVDGENSVRAEIKAGSLKVLGAIKGGKLDPGEPSAKDRQDIEATIVKDVLETQKYPTITFRTSSIQRSGDRYQVKGQLDLHGVVKEIWFSAERKGDRATARIPLQQPDFRIKPYRAFLGALRIKPEVVVEISVPIEGADASA